MCRAMYDYEWNVWVFEFVFHLNLFYSSFLVLTNAKCKCHAPSHANECCNQALPMQYATIMPRYAIDKLLTTDLDVNFLWMQTKCDASLDFCFWYKCFLTEMQMQFPWCRCFTQGWRCKVYSWWCQCTYLSHDADVSLRRWRMQQSCGTNAF